MWETGSGAEAVGGFRRLALVTRGVFGRYLLGVSIDQTGIWIVRSATGWVIWELTESPAWLGAIGFLSLAPMIGLGPVGGALADRVNRKAVVASSKAISAVVGWTIALLLMTRVRSPEAVACAIALNGVVFAIAQPSGKTLISELVSRKDLSAAVPLNSVVLNVAAFAGPALAGIVILRLGAEVALLIGGAMSFIHFLIVATLPLSTARRTRTPAAGLKAAMGLRTVLRQPGFMPLFLVHAASSTIGRPVLDMAPGIAAELFGRGAEGMASIASAIGGGAILGGVWLAQRGGRQGLARLVLFAAASMPVLLIFFVSMPTLALALPIAVLFGAAMVLRAAGVQTILQMTADDEYRGRVLGIYLLVLYGGGAVGGLLIGTLGEMIGLSVALEVTAGGALFLLAVQLIRSHRSILAIEDRFDRH
jgi:MFS family permease